MTERWRPIPGYEGAYEASDLGRIRSVRRTATDRGGRTRTWKGRVLRLKLNADGYPVAGLTRDNVTRSHLAHRLAALAFLGPCPPGQEVRHLDGNPANGALANLAYGTKSENAQDTLRHGTHPSARKTHCKWGHPFDESNTYVRPGPGVHRVCRTCRRASKAAARVAA